MVVHYVRDGLISGNGELIALEDEDFVPHVAACVNGVVTNGPCQSLARIVSVSGISPSCCQTSALFHRTRTSAIFPLAMR